MNDNITQLLINNSNNTICLNVSTTAAGGFPGGYNGLLNVFFGAIIAVTVFVIEQRYLSWWNCRKNLKNMIEQIKNEINYNIELCNMNEEIIKKIVGTEIFIPLVPFWHFAWDDWRGHYQRIIHTTASYTYIELINNQIELRLRLGNNRNDNSILYNINQLKKELTDARIEIERVKLKTFSCDYSIN